MKKLKYFDIVLFLIVSVLLILSFSSVFSDFFIVSLNDILLIALFIFSLRYVFFGSIKGQYILLVLIVIALPGVLKFNYTVNGSTYSSSSIAHIGSLTCDPYAFLLLMLYVLMNRKNIFSIVEKVFHESEEEREDKKDKAVLFYYDKFNNCTVDELNSVFKLFKEYPVEAQTALKQIHQERNLSLLSL